MEKTKVLLVITKGNWGGAQKYVFELATGLPQHRFDIKVLYGEGVVLPEKLKEAHIPALHIPELGRDIKIGSDIASFFKLLKIFKQEKPAIVHLNSSKIGGLGAIAARLAGIRKIIFTVHGFAFNEDRPFIQKIIIKFLSWLTVIGATHVICITKKEFEQAKKWPGTSKKLHLIYNGIKSPAFLEKSAAKQKFAHILNISENTLEGTVVGTIAELTKNKGHHYALKAFKKHPQIRWIVIGEGEERKKLEKEIKENNITNVFLAGFIADASTLLKAFDIFLLPSIKEGLPYVLIEAGFASLPVVATSVGGIPEIITHQESGLLIEPKNPEAISKALEDLADQDTRNEYGTRLFNKTTQAFALTTMIEHTEKLYH